MAGNLTVREILDSGLSEAFMEAAIRGVAARPQGYGLVRAIRARCADGGKGGMEQ